MLGWVLFNVWAPGGMEMFRDVGSDFERIWRACAFFAGMTAAFYIFYKLDSFVDFVADNAFDKAEDTPNQAGFPAKAARFGVRLVAGAFGFALALTGVVASALSGTVAFAGAFAIAFAGNFVSAGAFFVAAVVVGAAFIAVVTDLEGAALLFLLYVLLPILNAAADMVSLWITRGFLAGIAAHRPHLWWILGQMLLDLFLAALCLSTLLGCVIVALALWGQISLSTLPLDWRAYWAGVQADPRTGVSLYIMALTTLVPTVIHLIAGLGALWTQKARSLQAVVAQLSAQPEGDTFSEAEISTMKTQIGKATLWGYARAVLAVCVVFVPLIWGTYAWAV